MTEGGERRERLEREKEWNAWLGWVIGNHHFLQRCKSSLLMTGQLLRQAYTQTHMQKTRISYLKCKIFLPLSASNYSNPWAHIGLYVSVFVCVHVCKRKPEKLTHELTSLCGVMRKSTIRTARIRNKQLFPFPRNPRCMLWFLNFYPFREALLILCFTSILYSAGEIKLRDHLKD